jgi:flagellar basal-body rod modification protein FlgD
VIAPSATLTLADKHAAGAIELTEPADQVSVTIVGPAGDVVRRIELGPSAAGLKAFAWDGSAQSGGAAKDGSYSYRVDAVRGGKAVNATAYTLGTVTGIGVSGKDPTLIVHGGTEVRFADVKRVQ